jgi:hypothetical protein
MLALNSAIRRSLHADLTVLMLTVTSASRTAVGGRQILNFEGTLSSWWTKIVVGALLVFILLQRLVFGEPAARTRDSTAVASDRRGLRRGSVARRRAACERLANGIGGSTW